MHAQDMYSIISGTAKDVSMLIDFLQGYLYPYEEHGVLDYGVMGVSLGGHAAWLCLLQGTITVRHLTKYTDDRVKWGCSAIGCPSYIDLMEYRLGQSGLPSRAGPPYLPASFKRVLKVQDPGTILRVEKKIPLPLKEKHILVLSGSADQLVPWKASKKFITALQAESTNIRVCLYDGVGHEFTSEMGKEFYTWLHQFIM
jgi:hypothetical protein